VLLLAPVAAAMVAAPAYAQRAVVAPAAAIQQFEARPSGRLEQGSELRFRLVGAANGRATVDIPGVARGVQLVQVRPGVYEGSYTVRRRDSLDSFSEAIATLQSGNARATARADLRNVDREYGGGYGWGTDNRGPVIGNVSPAEGARVVERDRDRTTISARLSDAGRGIDPGSVTLRVDGRDVTRNARIDGNEINYRDDLGRGRHTAELTVRDRAGNTARKEWSFDVTDQRESNPAQASVQPAIAATAPSAPSGIFPGTLGLQVTSHGEGSVIDLVNQPLVLHGRTAPNAEVHVIVVAILAAPGGAAEAFLPEVRARADGAGNFTVVIPRASQSFAVTRYDVGVKAINGPFAAGHTLQMRQRF
jgi:hypothetical protein